jgi:hypothetical protein
VCAKVLVYSINLNPFIIGNKDVGGNGHLHYELWIRISASDILFVSLVVYC